MPVSSSFAYGAINPSVAFAMAMIGALFGLSCTARARNASARKYRVRWLLFGAVALSVVGVWLTHFIAVLGFDVPASPIRYSVWQTVLSLIIAVVVIGAGLQIVGVRRPTITRIVLAGLLIGAGISAMHYSGIDASHIQGYYTYDPRLVAASVLVAVLGSIVALALVTWFRSYAAVIAASVVFAVMVVSMHYTAMAALRIHLTNNDRMPAGVEAVSIVIPVAIGGILTLLAMLFAALAMMSDDDPSPDAPDAARSSLVVEWTPPIASLWDDQPPRSTISPVRHIR